MAYTFLPPRVSNYFPPGMPYLAGVRGLGDYASDLDAWKREQAYYQADLKRWSVEKEKHDAAMVAYNQAMSGLSGAYASALAQYQHAKTQWDADYNTYSAALGSWNAQVASIRAQNRARSEQIAKNYGVALPSSFLNGDACITQSQKDAYAKACRAGTVKGIGLGVTTSTKEDCAFAALPVCSFPTKPTLRPMPAPPTTPKPTPPAVVTTTPIVTTATAPETTPNGADPVTEDGKQANLVMGGLIVAAVIGGGYLVYRTLKKPKAQAA